ncbi:MAG: ASCH domain-containing protein [Xanthobacteraceae bacterium]|nr:ASCH domain-containing protein [Xanthobacteraceae bacterium]
MGETALVQIPALSVKQPWAELIVSGRKRMELRKWSTPYRGPIWLHAGATPDERAMAHFGMSHTFTGGYIGLVTIEDVVPIDGVRWRQWQELHLDPGSGGAGLFGWLLAGPRRLSAPISARGALKLFAVPPEMVRTLESRLLR